MKTAEFDIIVFGATGIVGKLVSQYLSDTYKNNEVKWAMAGRSLEKLIEVKAEIGATESTVLIVADVNDTASLDAMVLRTRTVISTVGPFLKFGEPVVAACAKNGTDYLDCTGEPIFIRKMIDTYSAQAAETGARIMIASAYDSIPSELGVYFLQQTAKLKFNKSISKIKNRVRSISGTFSGGTVDTVRNARGLATENPEMMDIMVNPYSLTPLQSGVEQPSTTTVAYDEDISAWTASYLMGSVNRQNVLRSNALLNYPYGTDFVYEERLVLNDVSTLEEATTAAALHPWSNWAVTLGDAAPKPGEGPGKEERENGFCDYLFIGFTDDGEEVRVSVKADQDPGYGATSKILAETAICMVNNGRTIPGGIWTAGAALGKNLIKRLHGHAGLVFEVE